MAENRLPAVIQQENEDESDDDELNESLVNISIKPKHNVSKWNMHFITKFGIFYDKTNLNNPHEIFSKAGKIKEFTNYQKLYMETLRTYLHFDALYERHEEVHHEINLHQFYSKYLHEIFEAILNLIDKHLTEQTPEEDHKLTNLYCLARQNVGNFIEELDELLRTVNEYESYTGNIPEDLYSELFQSFVKMCHLRSKRGSSSPTKWNDLQGRNVTSIPDYRVMKKGTSFGMNLGGDGNTVVSIVKITRGIHTKKNRVPKYEYSSSSSSCSSDSRESSFKCTDVGKRSSEISFSSTTSQEDIPDLESDLGSRVLGQHAGELLLDFQKYALGNTMPGIIVNKTKVYFTLLKMSGSHLVKLLANKELDKSKDRATIYYSSPLDILVEEDRNTLIESFMKFNNFQEVRKGEYNPG